MKRMRSKQINVIIIVLAIISLYAIIAIKFIPLLWILSILPQMDTEKANDAIYDFSVAYLSGCLIYLLTVVIKKCIRKSQQSWLGYDAMIEINHFIHNVLERCGVDKKPNVETIIQEIYNNEKMEIKDFIELSDDAEKCHKLIN